MDSLIKFATLCLRFVQIPALFIKGLFLKHPLRREKKMATELLTGLDSAYREIKRLCDQDDESDPAEVRLQRQATGLHKLMDPEEQFSYSILITAVDPHPRFFENAVLSALNQTAPRLEILVGMVKNSPQAPAKLASVIHRLEILAKAKGIPLSFHDFPPGTSPGEIYQSLVSRSQNRFILLFDGRDRIRADLLFRYEQTLRLHEEPERVAIYGNEIEMDQSDTLVPKSELIKPSQPDFPYYFRNWIGLGVMVSRRLWKSSGGMRTDQGENTLFDFYLRLDLAGAIFKNIPFVFYFRRTRPELAHESAVRKTSVAFFQGYCAKKNLRWEILPLAQPQHFRAIPQVATKPRVHVVILYKERKDLTLAAAKSALSQGGVSVAVTAVDNGSVDISIGEALQKMGVEVLRIEEPFNFSRLNNLAVKRSSCDFEDLLFLNNDAELGEGALKEMSGWLAQPGVGMVGCRLYFPDGSLQHGGVSLTPGRKAEEMTWEHSELARRDEDAFAAVTIRPIEAVTAACSMVRKDIFLKLGGFDEVFYPIAFSDTDLCSRFRKDGHLIIYTPFATGVHHESMSRGKHMIEDFEASAWLYEQRIGPIRISTQRILKLR